MPLQTEYNKDTIKESILNKLLRYYGCTIEDATPKQIYSSGALRRKPAAARRPSACITSPSSF